MIAAVALAALFVTVLFASSGLDDEDTLQP
jgi:hypothetical protein